MQAFELLGPGKINYHNEFIIAILAKCQAVANNTPSKWMHTELTKLRLLSFFGDVILTWY